MMFDDFEDNTDRYSEFIEELLAANAEGNFDSVFNRAYGMGTFSEDDLINIYNIYKNSTVTYSSFWGESNFTKSDGTHNYGWYHVSGSVEPNGTKHSITCYSAFYYTAQSCSDCISNDHCTTSRVLK